jgi:hypothetical protein
MVHKRRDLSLKVITGAGGSGKTRLAVELCEEMKKRTWTVGMPKIRWDGPDMEPLLAEQASRLIVIDYAEARPDEVVTLLPPLAASSRRRPTYFSFAKPAVGVSCRTFWACKAIPSRR